MGFALLNPSYALLADRASNLDVMTKLRAFTMICDRVPDAFMRAERKLKRDHARFAAGRTPSA
jgi:hypothetical protein